MVGLVLLGSRTMREEETDRWQIHKGTSEI